jgi:hypothetical protein
MSSVKASRAANELFDTLLSVPSISAIASSAVWTGVIVVIIIALIAAFVYRDSDDLLSRTMRVIFWGTLFAGAIMMLRERKLSSIVAENHVDKNTDEMFNEVNGPKDGASEVLLTRANTNMSQSNTPIVTDEQLAAVAARRGLTVVRLGHGIGTAVPAYQPNPIDM